jgi:crotonobetainyl-CoA:carnitine CoA-transferase CaiB-like acyl-CoA transferase
MMKPLEGIKVVEIGTYVAVPSTARVLGDWGADVIKIEMLTGDHWRNNGKNVRLPTRPDCNPIFAKDNSGKRFLSMNLKSEEGLEILHRLLAEADVFMSSVRYAGLTRLGLDYETLHEKYPKLIYAHFTGLGSKGPDAARPGFDHSAFWGRSGAFHEVRDVDGRPTIAPGGFGDTISSNALVGGICTALLARSRTGEGMRLDTSLYANSVWCNYFGIIRSQERPDGSKPYRNPLPVRERRNPFSNIYKCKNDTWFLLLGGNYLKFPRTMTALGLEEYIDDPRFATQEDREKNCNDIYDLFDAKFLEKEASEWADILAPLDISYQVLNYSSAVSKDEQAWANGFVGKMQCPDGTEWVMPTSPINFYGIEKAQTKHAGFRGCDNIEILKEYGYSDEEIGALYEKGIVSEYKPQ